MGREQSGSLLCDLDAAAREMSTNWYFTATTVPTCHAGPLRAMTTAPMLDPAHRKPAMAMAIDHRSLLRAHSISE